MPFPKHLFLQKYLFRYSLKIPACMIIFQILFGQKHCTLYLYSNGHVWIPIYEFAICASVKKHANRTPTFGNSSGIQKRLQMAVQVSPSHWPRKQYLYYGTLVTILKRVVKWAKSNLLQHVPTFWLCLFWTKKNAFRNYIIYLHLHLFTTKQPLKRWNEMKTKPCI